MIRRSRSQKIRLFCSLLGKGQELTLAEMQKIARSKPKTQAKQTEGDTGASMSAIKEDNKSKGKVRNDQ